MQNKQKYNRLYKNLKLIAVVLLLIITALILIIIIIEQPNENNTAQEQAAATHMSTLQTPTYTPVPTLEQVPTIEPTATAEPAMIQSVTAAPTSTPMPTFYITPEPLYGGDTVWINVSYLVIHDRPGFNTETIGHIPYGTKVTGEVDDSWMYTTYNGVSGYIYVGKMDGNFRPCAVYSENDLEPLD